VLDRYRPLVTYDNPAELEKLKKHAPHAGLLLRLRVPTRVDGVELSSKFGCDPGDAADLVDEAFRVGLVVEGLKLPRGQPVHQLRELRAGDQHGRGGEERGEEPRTTSRSRHRRRLPGALRPPRQAHQRPRGKINVEIARLFPPDIEILAEPGRYLVATRRTSVARVIGKAVRDGKPSYYIDDSVYHTYSGIIFDPASTA